MVSEVEGIHHTASKGEQIGSQKVEGSIGIGTAGTLPSAV